MAIGLFAAALAFGMAGTAGAAPAGNAPAVLVEVDGKTVDWGSDLYVSKGKIFVEYAALFKQLGYEADLDETLKTVYAESEDYEIQASVGGDIAIVNGRTVSSTGEVIEQAGRTYVGLRFAGTATNHRVEWAGKEKKVSLVFQGPTEADKASVTAFFGKMTLLEAANDTTGLMNLLAEDTVLDRAEVEANLKGTQTKTEITDIAIQSFRADEAVVVTTEDTKRLGGNFYPDNLSQMRYTLQKDSDGQWKMYNVETLDVQFTNIPGLFEQGIALPEAEKAAIAKVYDDQVKAANEKDASGYVATLADFPEKGQLEAQLADLFKTTTLNVSTEKLEVVAFDAEAGAATLLISMVSETEVEGETIKSRSVVLNDAVKSEGKWLLKAEANVLFSEQL